MMKHRIKRTLAAACAALMMAAGAGAEGGRLWVKVNADSCLCVRSQPRVGARVKYRLLRGDEVEPTEEKSGWYYVPWGEDGGWVNGAYLVSEPPLDEDVEPRRGVVSGNGRVAVRNAPGGKRVGWVHPGDKIEISGVQVDKDGQDWAIVDGRYIAMTYIHWEEDEHENLQ